MNYWIMWGTAVLSERGWKQWGEGVQGLNETLMRQWWRAMIKQTAAMCTMFSLQSVNSVSVKFTLIFHPGDMTSFLQMDLLSSSSSDSSTFSYLWLETNSHNWGRLSKITSFSVSFKAAQVKLQFKSPQLTRIHFFTFAAPSSHKSCFQPWLHNS